MAKRIAVGTLRNKTYYFPGNDVFAAQKERVITERWDGRCWMWHAG